jgi:hypothetical protein
METPLNRRSFLKLAAAAVAAVGAELAGCAPKESSMTDETITAEEMAAAFSEEVPEPSHLPLENNRRRVEVDRAIEQNREIKKRISEQASRRVQYRNPKFNTAYRFYVPADYQLPTVGQLDKTLAFLASHYNYEMAPSREVTVFVADLGPNIVSYTMMILLNKGKARTFINLNPQIAAIQFGEPLKTEFCQAFFLNATDLEARRVFGISQEVICNRFGIAAEFVGNGKTYQEYEDEAPTEGYGMVRKGIFQQEVGEINIGRYDDTTYKEVAGIFQEAE